MSAEEVLLIHQIIFENEYSECPDEDALGGVKDWDLLFSALKEPEQTFGGNELYPDVLSKAACYLRSFSRNHPFQNGNKRTALLATVTFLERNGYEVTANNEKMYKLVELVVTRKLKIESIKKRLNKFVKEIPRKRLMSFFELIEDTFRKIQRY